MSLLGRILKFISEYERETCQTNSMDYKSV